MPERSDKKNFWELAFYGLAGSAIGYVVSYYVNTTQNFSIDRYIDRSISILEDIRDRRKTSDYPER